MAQRSTSPLHLRVSGLTKSFGDRPILQGASLVVSAGERVALVGPNGCGKSTLLRIVAELDHPDSGSVELAPGSTQLGYLPQTVETAEGRTVGESLTGSLWTEAPEQPSPERTRPEGQSREALQPSPRAAELQSRDGNPEGRPNGATPGAAWALRARVETATTRLSDGDDALAEYSRLYEAFESAGGYALAEAMDAALAGLGVGAVTPEAPLATLSGGMRTRVQLAALLARSPDLLLLDEPTNHLDLPALEWLEGFVAGYPGAVLLVSHDRAFLDAVADRIVELDPATGQLASYVGGYTEYAAAKARELSERWSAYERQQKRITEFEANIRAAESRARGIEQTTIHFHWRKKAMKIAREVVVRKKRLERELDREGRIDKPTVGWSMAADLPPAAESGRDVLGVEGLAVSFDGRAVLDGVSLLVRRGERVVVIGANGSGKTTLLRAIRDEVTPKGGSVRLGAGVKVGYFAQGQENLEIAGTPLDLVRSAAPLDETAARRFLHRFLFAGDAVFTPIDRLSQGERARLLLAKLVLSGANLLLLDEPLSHLDLPSREAFESALAEYDGTVVAVLHDRYAIRRLATRVVDIAALGAAGASPSLPASLPAAGKGEAGRRNVTEPGATRAGTETD